MYIQIFKCFHSYLVSKTNEILNDRLRRQKRDVSDSQLNSDPNSLYTIEVLVVVDKSMRKFHNSISSDMTEYVLSLMSIAASVFADASIGNLINIAVIGIDDLTKDLGVKHLYEGNAIMNKHRNSKILNCIFF